MGRPPQGGGRRRGARRRHHDRGSLPLLPVVGGRVPVLGARVREARPCWFAHHARTAVSRTSFAPAVGATPAGYYSCTTEVPLRSKGGTPPRARASQKRSACELALPGYRRRNPVTVNPGS